MDRVLGVNDLTVSFDGQSIIRGLSFDLAAGESLAIIGPNGAGKSVLLRALLGLIPFTGTIAWAPDARIGYVPQKIEADRRLPISLHDLLRAKARILGIAESDAHQMIRAVAPALGVLDTPVGHLSGGQFQKALIALALLGNPTVLLFDEPTASLDEPSERHAYELIHELQDDRKITTVLVSHDLSMVNRYATRVLCLNREGVCFGTPEEALTPETLTALYGAPHKYYHHLHDGHGHAH